MTKHVGYLGLAEANHFANRSMAQTLGGKAKYFLTLIWRHSSISVCRKVCAKVGFAVPDVFRVANSFKIAWSVVIADAVLMVDLAIMGDLANKRLKHNPMHANVFGFAVDKKVADLVPVSICAKDERPFFSVSALRVNLWFCSKIAKGRDFVPVWAKGNRFPFFHNGKSPLSELYG